MSASQQQITIYIQTVQQLVQQARGPVYIISTTEQSENYISFFLHVTALNILNHVLVYRLCTGSCFKNFEDDVKELSKKLDAWDDQISQYLKKSTPEVLRGVINPKEPLSCNPFKEEEKTN